jgi:thymidylate synthase ThyX
VTTTSATILADSVSPAGVRLTTFELIFPRFILAELNTHRVFSRNSASSRAIPPEKQIERVLSDPFIPEFGSRVVGMGEGELDSGSQTEALLVWTTARDHAVAFARRLLVIGVDKSRINRLLEPFMWHTAIVSSTEWSNFFALRCDTAAQKEFRELATLMRSTLEAQEPGVTNYGEWHLPLVPDFPYDSFDGNWAPWIKRSVSRCARVSYDRQHDDEPLDKTLERYEKLKTSGHLSPFEHAATPWNGSNFPNNFRGWAQHRSHLSYQSDRNKYLESLGKNYL